MNIPQLNIIEDDVKPDSQIWNYFRQRDFTGGENRLLLPESLQPNQLQLAYNCIINADGLPETRTGKSIVNTNPLSGAITSMHRFSTEAGVQKLLVQCGTVMYVYAYDGSTQFGSFSSLATGLDTAKFRSVSWKNKLFLTNGVDNVKVYDGTTWADLGGSPPKSKVIKVYGGRLYLVDVANPNTLRFSGLESAYTTWDALNLINVRSGDNDSIVGISPQPGGLVIFKNNSIWTLYGTSLSTFRLNEAPMSANIGCVSADSILDEGMFLGANNIYSFNLSGITAIADTHRPLIEALSLDTKQAAFAAYDPRKKHALIHLGSYVLCLNEQMQCITTWDSLNAQCFCQLDAATDDGAILVGDVASGVVYKMDDSENDADIPINSQIVTAYLDYGIIGKKLWRWFSPEIESLTSVDSTMQYTWDVDYSKLTDILEVTMSDTNTMTWDVDSWDQKNWGETVRITTTFFMHRAYGNRIAFKIAALDRIKFLGYTTKYREAGAL